MSERVLLLEDSRGGGGSAAGAPAGVSFASAKSARQRGAAAKPPPRPPPLQKPLQCDCDSATTVRPRLRLHEGSPLSRGGPAGGGGRIAAASRTSGRSSRSSGEGKQHLTPQRFFGGLNSQFCVRRPYLCREWSRGCGRNVAATSSSGKSAQPQGRPVIEQQMLQV